MRKKQYEKPSMKVYPLRQKPKLMVGSNGGLGSPGPFEPGGNPLNS